jgi:hypothetical protein
VGLLPAAEGKKKIKGEGRPTSVNRERDACGRPCSLWFFAQWEGGRAAPLKKDRFRVRVFFFCIFLMFQNCSLLLSVLKVTIYRQNVAWASKLVP